MEKEPKSETSREHLKNFIEIYDLFSHNEISRLLTNNKVNINFNTQSLGKHNFIKLNQGDIFSYRTETGRLIKIKIIDLNIEPLSNNSKRYMQGQATFEIIK